LLPERQKCAAIQHADCNGSSDLEEPLMAVRDVVDENGTKWKIWSVTQSSIHPKTAAEDYLGDYSEGWLCFECDNQRRRLARYPQDWDKLPDKELVRLLKAAQVVAPRRNTPPKPGDAANP
jgi:hypothetical protein